MTEWVQIVNSIGTTVAGVTITTILIYRAGCSFMDKILIPVRDRLFSMVDKIEQASDRTRERDRSSDSWRVKTTVKLEMMDDRLQDTGSKCDRLIHHLLPAKPTSTHRQQDQSHQPGDR